MIVETSYSIVKRLNYISSAISSYMNMYSRKTASILDVGCGTGEFLTIPLAMQLDSSVEIFAYEPDTRSSNYLLKSVNELRINNLKLIENLTEIPENSLDVIIASEVLEHVENPELFINEISRKLKISGLLILTVPNGFGVFEMENLVFNTLEWIRLIPLLRRLKSSLMKSNKKKENGSKTDTLADSPHIQFYKLNDIYRLLNHSGFILMKIEGKHFIAGPFSDRLLRNDQKLLKMNNTLGSKLPLKLVSGWMIVAKKENQGGINDIHRPHIFFWDTYYRRYKRYINLALLKRQSNHQ